MTAKQARKALAEEQRKHKKKKEEYKKERAKLIAKRRLEIDKLIQEATTRRESYATYRCKKADGELVAEILVDELTVDGFSVPFFADHLTVWW